MAHRLGLFLEPHVERHLIATEGEQIIDEVGKHWVVYVAPVSAALTGAALFLIMAYVGWLWPLLLVVGLVLSGWGLYRIHDAYMDRFVITTMRVFRVYGVFNQRLATMPMTRILDITVYQPFFGRLLGFGHFTFESAAQEQGLRDIRYVAHPEQRDLTIQRTIQRAGIRKESHPWAGS